MSAYLCDSIHISACADMLHILRASGRGIFPEGLADSPEGIFTQLLNENLKSLHSRYENTQDWDEDSLFMVYEPQNLRENILAYNLPARDELSTWLKALKCLEYQSCEHDDWAQSVTAQAIREARALLSQRVIEGLTEYEQAEWGWKPRSLQLVRVRR